MADKEVWIILNQVFDIFAVQDAGMSTGWVWCSTTTTTLTTTQLLHPSVSRYAQSFLGGGK